MGKIMVWVTFRRITTNVITPAAVFPELPIMPNPRNKIEENIRRICRSLWFVAIAGNFFAELKRIVMSHRPKYPAETRIAKTEELSAE